jgi:hypothetical protein
MIIQVGTKHLCQFSLLYTYAFCMNSIFHQKLHHVKTLSKIKIKIAKKCHWLGLIRKETTEKFLKFCSYNSRLKGSCIAHLTFENYRWKCNNWQESLMVHDYSSWYKTCSRGLWIAYLGQVIFASQGLRSALLI